MNHSTISLPNVRAHQLRHIAAELDCTATDFLDDYIAQSWEHLGWAGVGYLPPWDIGAGTDDETGQPRVYLTHPGAPILDLGIPEARRLASGIKEITKSTLGPSKIVVHANSGGDLGGVVVERKGRGLVFKFCDTLDGAPRTFVVGLTRSVAKDLAAAIIVHADRALAAAEAAA